MATQTSSWRVWKVLLSVLVVVTCLRVWGGPVGLVAPAQAQVPDAGLQRKQLLAEATRTNELLQELITLLKTQPIQVRVESSDKSEAGLSGAPGVRPPRGTH